MASVKYEAKRNSVSAVSAWLLQISFPAFFEIPAKDFYFSTTEGMETDLDTDGEEIRGLLMSVPLGRHQRDRGNDYAEFSLANPHNDTYQDFLQYEDLIERAQIKIFQCFEIEKDYWEGEQRFYGYLKDFTINESDKSLSFTAISDMSRAGFMVGARILTRERCGTEFNFGGLNAPEFHACGWQLAMGGNPDFCSKFLKGVDGCVAHGNAHRFFALPALTIASITFVPSGEIDFPYDTSACFTKDMFVILPDWSIKPINQMKKGIIKGTDIFTGKVIDTEILRFDEHIVESIALAEMARGSFIETRNEHLFRTNGSTFAPVGALEGKWCLGLDNTRKPAQDKFMSIRDVYEKQSVYSYLTKSHTFLITDENMNFIYDVHNQKWHIPVEF